MDIDEYVSARHTLLVRTAVLLGRPLERSRALVGRAVVQQARAVRRSDDPDPAVLRAVHALVRTDRDEHPGEAVPTERPDHPPGEDREGLVVRRELAAMPAPVRDAAVLLHFARLSAADTAEALTLRPRELPALAREAMAALGAADGDDARQRLTLAADTVLVEPPGALPWVHTPRRGRLLAAALGLAVLAVAAVVALGLDGGPSPQRSGATTPRAAPGALFGDQLPSFFGQRVPDVLARLHDRALLVSIEQVDVCEPPDVVLATSPGVGVTYRPGDRVIVTVARRDVRPCPGYRDRVAAWRFIHFAAGRGPAPRFAPTVRVVDRGADPATLTRADATARRGWGDALTSMTAAVSRIGVDSERYVTPDLTVRTSVPVALTCGLPRPAAVGRRPALELSVTLPTEPGRCPYTVDLYRTRGGQVDAVVVRGPG